MHLAVGQTHLNCLGKPPAIASNSGSVLPYCQYSTTLLHYYSTTLRTACLPLPHYAPPIFIPPTSVLPVFLLLFPKFTRFYVSRFHDLPVSVAAPDRHMLHLEWWVRCPIMCWLWQVVLAHNSCPCPCCFACRWMGISVSSGATFLHRQVYCFTYFDQTIY